MDYQKIYNSLIEKGKNRKLDCYVETHHIIPRCMNGSDDIDNLVELTPEEHYLAHQLLVKIYPDNYSLVKAAQMMIPNRPSNKMYGWLRRRFSKVQSISQSGEGNSQYGKIWITNGFEETKTFGEIPDGWQRGRLSSYLNSEKKDEYLRLKKEKAAIKIENRRKELRYLYEIYKVKGFDGVKEVGYEYSKPNLVASFAKYLPEFTPQNGKPRKVNFARL